MAIVPYDAVMGGRAFGKCMDGLSRARSADSVPLAYQIRELLEDEFEKLTGEPRIVTGLDIQIEPASGTGPNWSATLGCEREYAYAWQRIYDETQKKFPRVLFG